jgi:septal ring factor EnvC (AmiA/AmiB activator)
MKRMMVLLLSFVCLCSAAEKESFKKKRVPSLRTLTEQYGQELTETMKEMPKLQRHLAKQQKELARLQEETIATLSDLLENDLKLDKKEVQQRLDEAKKLNAILQTQIESNQRRIAELRQFGKQKAAA